MYAVVPEGGQLGVIDTCVDAAKRRLGHPCEDQNRIVTARELARMHVSMKSGLRGRGRVMVCSQRQRAWGFVSAIRATSGRTCSPTTPVAHLLPLVNDGFAPFILSHVLNRACQTTLPTASPAAPSWPPPA